MHLPRFLRFSEYDPKKPGLDSDIALQAIWPSAVVATITQVTGHALGYDLLPLIPETAFILYHSRNIACRLERMGQRMRNYAPARPGIYCEFGLAAAAVVAHQIAERSDTYIRAYFANAVDERTSNETFAIAFVLATGVVLSARLLNRGLQAMGVQLNRPSSGPPGIGGGPGGFHPV